MRPPDAISPVNSVSGKTPGKIFRVAGVYVNKSKTPTGDGYIEKLLSLVIAIIYGGKYK